MTPGERKQILDEVASQLWESRRRLQDIFDELTLDMDRRAIRATMADLTWGAENCSVVGKHQIGEAMDDTMGLAGDDAAH